MFYDYKCDECGKSITQNRSVDERNEIEECACGGRLVREYSFRGAVWAPTAGGYR